MGVLKEPMQVVGSEQGDSVGFYLLLASFFSFAHSVRAKYPVPGQN